MEWIRYRKKFAWGQEEWIYKPIDKYWHEESFIHTINSEYDWSDKYRGVEVESIAFEKIPNDKIKEKIEQYKKKVDSLDKNIRYYKDLIKEMENKK